MKRILSTILAAIAVLSVASCAKDELPAAADTTSIRVALTPAPGTIPAAGASFESAVVVHLGAELNVDWTVSVDFEPEWVVLEKTKVQSEFVGTYNGDDRNVTLDGISVFVMPNETGAKRAAVLRFTTADGSSVTYTLTQAK